MENGQILSLIIALSKKQVLKYGSVGVTNVYANATGDGIAFELANGNKQEVKFGNFSFMKLSDYDKNNDGIIDLADICNFAKESEKSKDSLKLNGKEASLYFQKDIDTLDNVKEGIINKFLKPIDKSKLNNLPLDTNIEIENVKTQTNLNKLNIDNLQIDNTKNRNDINQLKNDAINKKDELVKLNATDTADYLGNKIDNKTITIQNNKLIAKTLNGLTATLAELNMLQGVKSNIQSQINSIAKGMEYKGQINSHTDLVNLLNPQNGWTVIVKVDETQNNKKMFYIYDGTKWEATYEVSATSMGRDFLTDGIDLTTETKGILPKERISDEIARQFDLDKKINKVASAVQNNIAILNADGTIKDSGKNLNNYSENTHTHKDLEDKINLKADKTELHNHNNKDLLDKFIDDGVLKYNEKEIGGKQILEFTTKSDFPKQGEENKIYVDKSKNIQHRWDNIKNEYVAYNGGNNSTGTGSAITVIDNTSNINKEITTNLNKLTVEGNASVSSYTDGEVKVKIKGLSIENNNSIITNNANTLKFEGLNVHEENHKIIVKDKTLVVNAVSEIPIGLPNDTRILVRNDVKVGYKPSEYVIINGIPQLILDNTGGGGNTVQNNVDGIVNNSGKLTIQYPATLMLPNLQVSKFEEGKTNQNYIIEAYDDIAINNYDLINTEIKEGVLRPKTKYVVNSDSGVLTDNDTYKVFTSEEIDLSKYKNIENIV